MAQFLGTVIGTKMDKTAKVLVTRMVLHPTIKKYWNKRKVYFAHDENNECTRGDLVRIKECRPLSKMKNFNVEEIVQKAQKVVDTETGEVHIQDNRE
ncbi:30S ribosomal protein S17 [Exaiptasia diaphana]|nr:30S ribosomal protein S17 [Exaiptasia diaphana]